MKSSMFDLFPNELFYDVFEYLTTYDILYAFKGINTRIDTLLGKYVKYDLDFKSWPKSKFDFNCQSIRPEQVRTLILSSADDTCRQIHKFFELFYIRQFINLQSLTLIQITEQELNKIVTKLNHLSKLSHLSIKLVDSLIPQITVPSIKYLSISICSMSRLQQILLCTPILKYLNVQLIADPTPTSDSFPPTEIRQLKIELVKKSNIAFNDIQVLFLCMPKLQKFTFIAPKGIAFIHGERWEHLIRTYLPQLKEFHFKIHPHIDNINIQQLLGRFQTQFWRKEKQWFIHCDLDQPPSIGYTNTLWNVHLYTLPYSDEQFYLSLSTNTITNICKNEYSTIKNLYLSIDRYYDKKIIERYYFPNLSSLTIRNLHKLVSIDNLINLSQIEHLTIEQNNAISSEHFYSYILIHSRKLYSLELSWHTLEEITNNFTDQQVCALLNKQIKNLNLLNMIPNNDEDIRKRIEILSQLFSTNLEKLCLSVTSMDYIPLVLNEMPKLYSVQIECHSFNTTMTDNELLLWLSKNVPRLTNFTYQIRLVTETRVCLLLWIANSRL